MTARRSVMYSRSQRCRRVTSKLFFCTFALLFSHTNNQSTKATTPAIAQALPTEQQQYSTPTVSTTNSQTMPRTRGTGQRGSQTRQGRHVTWDLPAHRTTGNATRRHRTPDLFANTSLEEDEPSDSSLSPRFIQSIMEGDIDAHVQAEVGMHELVDVHSLSEEEIDAFEREEHAMYELADYMEQREEEKARDKKILDKSNAIFDDQKEFRKNEKPAQEHFAKALEQWKKDDADEHAKFMEHYEMAKNAATEPVRVMDMTSWYPRLPALVAQAIKHLQVFYHRNVNYSYGIAVFDELLGDAVHGHGLHPEVYHASRRDRASSKKGNGLWQTFGLDLKHNDLAYFEENFAPVLGADEPGLEASRVMNILANFRVRRTLLEGTGPGAHHSDQRRPRYDELSIIKFKDTQEWDLIQWGIAAVSLMELTLWPLYQTLNRPKLVDSLDLAIIEIATYILSIDKIGVCDMRDSVSITFRACLDALRTQFATSSQPDASDDDRTAFLTLKEEAWQMVLKFQKFERQHGFGILGRELKDLQMDNVDLLGTNPHPAMWSQDDEEYIRRCGHPDEDWAADDSDESEQDQMDESE